MMFTHRDHLGRNSVHLSGKGRSLGRYRLQVVPRNRAGSGRKHSVFFRIVR